MASRATSRLASGARAKAELASHAPPLQGSLMHNGTSCEQAGQNLTLPLPQKSAQRVVCDEHVADWAKHAFFEPSVVTAVHSKDGRLHMSPAAHGQPGSPGGQTCVPQKPVLSLAVQSKPLRQ